MTSEHGRQPDRLEGWDVVRGVAIVFVVVIHAGGPLEPDAYRNHVIGGIARLGVPLFVLLSGALAGYRATPSERFASYFSRFVRLHLIYGTFYAVFHLAAGGELAFDLKWLVLRFSGTGWPGQYYFWILIQLYFLSAFLVPARLWSRGWMAGVCACLVPIALGVYFGVRQWLPLVSLPYPVRLLLGSPMLVWLWLYYFALGAWVGGQMRRGAAWAPGTLGTSALLVLAAVVATFGVPLPGDDLDPRGYSYERPRIYLATTLVALALPSIGRNRFGPWLRWLSDLGRNSFGIFVLNPAILIVLFRIVGAPDAPATSLLLAAATLAVSRPVARWMRLRLPWLYA